MRGNESKCVAFRSSTRTATRIELDVQRVVRSGSKTEALNLKGRDRAIQRIDMTYRQREDFAGRATVSVEGLVG